MGLRRKGTMSSGIRPCRIIGGSADSTGILVRGRRYAAAKAVGLQNSRLSPGARMAASAPARALPWANTLVSASISGQVS